MVSDRGVGKDFESGQADAFAKCKIFSEVPVAASILFDQGLKPRCHCFAEHGVAIRNVGHSTHPRVLVCLSAKEKLRVRALLPFSTASESPKLCATSKAKLNRRQQLAGLVASAIAT